MNYLLIGKPNVGKSSIFNLLSNSKHNIVHSESGTTRDWHKEILFKSNSYVYDTPGVLIEDNKKLFIDTSLNLIIKSEIDIFLYVVDYKIGFNQIDDSSLRQLRKFNKEIILIVNKFDNYISDRNDDFSQYGIKKTIFVSCAHNFGFEDLKNLLPLNSVEENLNLNFDYSIAIFGKPNAGKSTFLNSLMGYKRSQTSPIAGTTSDYVTDYLKFNKKIIKIIDTAGIGKKSNIKNKSVTDLSLKKTFNNISNVDSSIVIIDANEGLDRQDKRIIKMISDSSKSLLVIFNKLDLVIDKDEFKSSTINDIQKTVSETKNIKIFFISSLKKDNVTKVFDYLYNNIFMIDYKISTGKLNKWLINSTKDKQHPLIEGKRVNFKYAVQVKKKPVTIKIFCSYSGKLRQNYKRYLINNFNYNFKILNQNTKLIFSSSKNPYI